MTNDTTGNGGSHTTRRSVLRATTGAVAGLGATGLAAAESGDRLEVNVGFANERGRQAAVDAATDVRREFAFDALTMTVPEQAVSGLRRNPNVRYVEENGEMHALEQTTPWGVDRVGAPTAHDADETGEGAHIAILDTGIDSTHEALQDVLGEGESFTGCGGLTCFLGGNGNDCNESWDDDNDHGTHCAGTAVAPDDGVGVVGVSTQATLHAVKVLDCLGSGSMSDIAAGIEYTADQGWDVCSMSLGGGQSDAVSDAVSYAHERGVFLVAAAGNDGPCTDCVSYPAAEPEVVAVSATSEDDSLASFSSTGPEIELAAPGEDVYSTVAGGYDTFSGTSMACPHVAGAAGQLMANGYDHEAARDRLHESAEDIGLEENEQGHGLLRVDDALDL
ncbi:S8 family peptidase [Natrononativus amylolyticus]|uniref:S8 family peptidase n=1 Tax=Natrononativus amylolyticus TaxID=2963434 RepID=UPI0020CC046E|nr:S8 family peptidase [Natrononativus amylolyticus]